MKQRMTVNGGACMNIREADLPGVGKKYTVNTSEGEVFTIIIHHTGRREIYLMDRADINEPAYTFNLSDDEARRVGAILLGADYQPVSDDKVELMIKSMFIEWVKITPESPAADKTLKESKIKESSGVTIIGIQREKDMIVSPGPEEVLRSGDLLMVVGKRDQLKALEPLCKEHGVCGTD